MVGRRSALRTPRFGEEGKKEGREEGVPGADTKNTGDDAWLFDIWTDALGNCCGRVSRAPQHHNGPEMMTMRLRDIASISLLALLVASSALAQDYPSRRITIIVPFSPGTAFDVIARQAGQKVSERWGQPVVVDNKPGASGTLGSEMVALAAPDGYTLGTVGAPITVHKPMIRNLRYDPLTSFTPIGVLATNTVVLVVNPEVFPVNSLAELIAAVKAKPGEYNYSSPGVGTLQQLGMELFQQQLGLKVQHIPYRGQGQALTDFVSGQVHFTYLPVNSALPHVQAGKLRVLAATGSKRSPILPDVPTFAELGHASVDFDLWFGFFGPAGLPPAVVRKWEAELKAISALPDVRENLSKRGLTPTYLDAAATEALMMSEIARWTAVAEQAGIRAR
jgi:tripartite-type tricarboxylate transporter receptor subunit TctC